jgi:hypothetical protein
MRIIWARQRIKARVCMVSGLPNLQQCPTLTGKRVDGCNWELHVNELQVLAKPIEYRAAIRCRKERHGSATNS